MLLSPACPSFERHEGLMMAQTCSIGRVVGAVASRMRKVKVRASHRAAEDWDSSHVDVPVGATAVEALHLGAAADCSSACEMGRMSDHLPVRINLHAEAAVPSSCTSCAGQKVVPRGSQESHPMWKILANVEATGGPNHGKILKNHAALPPCELCGPRRAGRQRLVEVFAGSRLDVATLIATDNSRQV